MLLTVGDGLSEKSIVSFDGNVAPFGIMEFAAGLSVTGRECAYAHCEMDNPPVSPVDINTDAIMHSITINFF